MPKPSKCIEDVSNDEVKEHDMDTQKTSFDALCKLVQMHCVN